MVWRKVPAGATWTKINKEGGGSKSVAPEARRYVCMEEEGPDTIVNSAKDAINPSILL